MDGYQKEARLKDDDYHGWWSDAVGRSSAPQSALLRRFYDEVATLNGQPSVCLFFDLEKFYDSVCLHKLIGLALERNFPKQQLHFAA